MKLIKKLRKKLSDEHLMFAYRGEVTGDNSVSLLTLLEREMEFSDFSMLGRKRLFMFVLENLQNITRHGISRSEDITSLVVYSKTPDGYTVSTGNALKKSEVRGLRKNLQKINNLDPDKIREVYRTMQMVFQTPADSFDPRRTLGDGIGESLRNAGLSQKETRKKVEALLKDCGLPPEYADRYPHQVSGGQCQRAAIARALAIEPRLLICDEITSALDVTVQKEILELLNTLRTQQGRDLSILFISHDISLVQQFCDRVLVMYHGEIVEEGTPDEVIRNPQNDYTKRLIDSVLS